MAKFKTFYYSGGVLYGYTVTVTAVLPDRGPSTGGQAFVLEGTGFEFPDNDDTFTGGSLDPAKWTNVSTGTGAVSTGAGHLRLTTGSTSSSYAGIRSITIFGSAQYETRVNIPPVTSLPTGAVKLFDMSLRVDSNNFAEQYVRLNTDGTIELVIKSWLGGRTVDQYTCTWTTGISTFKILRYVSDVYFYANGSLVYMTHNFISTGAKFAFWAYNATASYNVSNVVVEYVYCRPFAAFDNEVVHDLTVVSAFRARGITPASVDKRLNEAGYAGLVDVTMVAGYETTASDAYEYYYEDGLTMLDNSGYGVKLSLIDDPAVKTPVTAVKGLGEGK